MGNIGRSSTGCGLCRKRKIKCDEARPGCRKCAQLRKPCPGYPFQVQLNIRLETDGLVTYKQYQQTGIEGSRGNSTDNAVISCSRSKTEPEESDYVTVKAEAGSPNEPMLHLIKAHRPESPPRYDINHQSLCFFLNLFCFQATKIYSFPILDFLPDIIQSSTPNSCINYAATAVSRMTLADRYSGKDVRLQTADEYGKALSITNKALRTSSENISDDTVVAVWLLGLYEHVSAVLSHNRSNGEARDPQQEWKSHISHIRGALNLLRIRGKSQFNSPRSEKIFRVLKAAIQMRLFALNSVTSQDFTDLEVDIYRDEHEFIPSKSANIATGYFLKVARLCESARQYLRRPITDENFDKYSREADQLIESGESLDASIADWSKLEPGWEMMKVRGDTTTTMWSLYPSHALYYFYSFWVFLYWLRLLIARVKLYEALAQLTKSNLGKNLNGPRKGSSFGPNVQISTYKTIIQMTAAELIGLTAYALGDVTSTGAFYSSGSGLNPGRNFQEVNVVAAMQLVIPLKTLQRSEHVTATQKGAIDLAISHIGDGFRRQPLLTT